MGAGFKSLTVCILLVHTIMTSLAHHRYFAQFATWDEEEELQLHSTVSRRQRKHPARTNPVPSSPQPESFARGRLTHMTLGEKRDTARQPC